AVGHELHGDGGVVAARFPAHAGVAVGQVSAVEYVADRVPGAVEGAAVVEDVPRRVRVAGVAVGHLQHQLGLAAVDGDLRAHAREALDGDVLVGAVALHHVGDGAALGAGSQVVQRHHAGGPGLLDHAAQVLSHAPPPAGPPARR